MKEHLIHYLTLLVILDLAIGAFFMLSFSRIYQALVVVAMGVLYVIWGIIHHYLSEDFHLKVVFEYILISILAILVILALLYRS